MIATRLRPSVSATFRSLHVRNFRLLFLGQLLSQSGTWMQTIALEWHVLRLTDDGTALGLVTAFQFLPVLLLSAWAGVVIDRVNKRRLLYVTQSLATVLAAATAALAFADRLSVPVVYTTALCLGLITAFDNPARKAFLSETVGREDLANAVSLNSSAMNGARIVGPALAGVVLSVGEPAWCFLVNAGSYLAVLVALLRMRGAELLAAPLATRARGQVREGLRYVRRHRLLWPAVVMLAVVGTFGFNFRVVLPLLADRELGGGASTYTLLYSMMSAGSLAGTLWMARRTDVGLPVLALAAVHMAAALVLLALVPSIVVAVIACVLVGFSSMTFMSGVNAMLQLEATPAMRGRVLSLHTMVFLGSTPIGGPVIGWVSERFGTPAGILAGAAAAVVAAVIGVAAHRSLISARDVPPPVEPRPARSRQPVAPIVVVPPSASAPASPAVQVAPAPHPTPPSDH